MTVRKVLIYPDKRLRNKAIPVEHIDESVKTLVADMFDTMYQGDGCGLAATQVGVPLRVVVMDFSDDRSGQRVFINPKILESDDVATYTEGCLSVPGLYEKVKRAGRVKFQAQDIDGKIFEEEAEAGNLLCNCIQHEIDHLDGIVFIDKLPSFKRQSAIKKLKKRHKQTL